MNPSNERAAELDAAELRSAMEELEAINYSVSHDLRSPMGAIFNYAAILREDFGDSMDEVAKGYLERIEANAKKVVGMVDDLVEFTSAARKTPEPVALDLGQLVRSCFNQATDEKARGRLKLEVGDLPSIHADPQLTELALREVIENAVRFSNVEAGGVISVSAELTAEGIVLTVQDDGVGFDLEDPGRLLRLFERVGDRPDLEGRGRGLALASRAVRCQGGRIDIESAPGSGTVVRISLQQPGRGRDDR